MDIYIYVCVYIYIYITHLIFSYLSMNVTSLHQEGSVCNGALRLQLLLKSN